MSIKLLYHQNLLFNVLSNFMKYNTLNEKNLCNILEIAYTSKENYNYILECLNENKNKFVFTSTITDTVLLYFFNNKEYMYNFHFLFNNASVSGPSQLLLYHKYITEFNKTFNNISFSIHRLQNTSTPENVRTIFKKHVEKTEPYTPESHKKHCMELLKSITIDTCKNIDMVVDVRGFEIPEYMNKINKLYVSYLPPEPIKNKIINHLEVKDAGFLRMFKNCNINKIYIRDYIDINNFHIYDLNITNAKVIYVNIKYDTVPQLHIFEKKLPKNIIISKSLLKSASRYNLTFSHPVKELIWAARRYNTTPTTLNGETIQTIHLN